MACTKENTSSHPLMQLKNCWMGLITVRGDHQIILKCEIKINHRGSSAQLCIWIKVHLSQLTMVKTIEVYLLYIVSS